MEPQQRTQRGSGRTVMPRNLKANDIHTGKLMSFWPARMVLSSLVFLLSIFPFGGILHAQTATGVLNGVVTDPSGGVIAKAAVRLTTSSGASLAITTNRDGSYEFEGLVPGTYALKAVAKGFAIFTQENVQIFPRQIKQLNIRLLIQIAEP